MSCRRAESLIVNDRYEITESPLGEGAAGVVYKAYDNVNKRFVALKTLWIGAVPGSLGHFEGEWTVLARVSHPNIVDILDTGNWVFQGQRQDYFVMPFLTGDTLKNSLRISKLPVERSVDIISQACRGLQAAHDQGLIHGNIRPSNIFIMEDETVKVLDLGVRHAWNRRSGDDWESAFLYSAPEQLELKPATPVSDIYSLAVVCYEALTGRKPFVRDSEAATVEAIRWQIPPRASEINPAVNQMVGRVVHKAMAKQPWHRFSQAREFAEALEKAVRSEPIERFERSQTQHRIERVKKAHSEGDEELALEILTEIESEEFEPNTSALRIQIEEAIRQKNIRQLLESARIRMEEEEYPLALQKIAAIFAVDPSNTEAQAMKEQIERQHKEHRLEDWFQFVREQMDCNLFSQARQGLREVLRLDSSNRQAHQMLREIDQTERMIVKLEIREKHVNTHPANPIFQAFELQAKEIQRKEPSAIAEVSERVDAEPDLDKKYSMLKEVVEQYPSEPNFRSALKLIRDRCDLVNGIVSRARQHEEGARFDDAAGQWDILRNIYPLYPGLDSELERLKRCKEEQIKTKAKAGWIERIEAHCNLAEYAHAGSVAEEALNEFPDDRELLELRSLAEQGVKRNAEANALLNEGQNLCAARNYKDGLEFLRKAGRLDPRNITARAALLSALLAHARELISKDWHAGEPLVKEALALEPSDPVARSLLSVVDDHRRQDVIGNILTCTRNYQAGGHLSDAFQLVEKGLVQYPNDHRLMQLLSSLRIEAGQPAASSAGLDAASPDVPIPADAVQLKPFAASSIIAASSSEVAPSAATAVAMQGALAVQPTRAKPVTSWPPTPGNDLILRPPLSLSSGDDDFRLRRPAWAVAAFVAVAVILAGFYWQMSTPRPTKAASRNLGKLPDARIRAAANPQPAGRSRVVVFEANVPGTRFSEDGKPLSLASELPPGNHIVEALHEGYLPQVKSFVVATANTPLNLKFELQPMLPQLRLSSYIGNGTLVLDDKESLDLRAGMASKEALALGPHTVKIYDGGRPVFAFAFQVEADQKPMLTTPLLTQPISGAVVASLGGSAKIYTTRGLRAALMGPQAAAPLLVPVPPLGLEIPGSPDNPARFSLETGTGKPTPQLADSSAVPTLTVHLEGAPEMTYVTVISNASDCIISVDGGEGLKQSMSGKSQSLPLAAGTHPVRLTCPGYQDTEQTVDIQPGDAGPHKMDFVMRALPAQVQTQRALLTISGAPPETPVFQNQIRIGTVGADGSFSEEIDPGTYTWEWNKPGFETRKEVRTVTAGESLRLDGALTPSTGSLVLKGPPETAHISAQRNSDSNPIVLPNNVPAQLVPPPARFLKNGDSWQQIGDGDEADAAGTGWWIGPGSGYSSLRAASGSFSIDFLKTKALRTKRISMLADCPDSANCIVYSLDEHNLTSRRIAGDKIVMEEKKPHGMDDDSSFHLLFEMSPDLIVVKNRSGAVLSSMERHDPRGPLLIQNDNPLNIN